jgi:hypothetical protein
MAAGGSADDCGAGTSLATRCGGGGETGEPTLPVAAGPVVGCDLAGAAAGVVPPAATPGVADGARAVRKSPRV